MTKQIAPKKTRKPRKKMASFLFKIAPEQLEALKLVAQENQMSAAKVLRRLVARHLRALSEQMRIEAELARKIAALQEDLASPADV